ncbi:phosphopantetheine-binding protein [Streptomyces tricolor]|nr:phosphopantetheine-binding protein [Streptomyces tricolor]
MVVLDAPAPDRQRQGGPCRAPRTGPGRAGVPGAAPRTPMESRLAALCAELLDRDDIAVHDDFFALGEHSLLATQLVTRVRTEFAVDVIAARLLRGAHRRRAGGADPRPAGRRPGRGGTRLPAGRTDRRLTRIAPTSTALEKSMLVRALSASEAARALDCTVSEPIDWVGPDQLDDGLKTGHYRPGGPGSRRTAEAPRPRGVVGTARRRPPPGAGLPVACTSRSVTARRSPRT